MIKKGLITALTIVAFASIQVQSVQASAPVIRNIIEVIVGDAEGSGGATGTGVFVFPDAIDLEVSVTDDDTASSEIKWSYASTNQRYTINGAPELTGDATDPDPGERIDLVDNEAGDASTGQGTDANARTISFRDVAVSPNNTPNAPAPADTVLGSSIVTLFASDCSTFSMHSFPVSTVVGQTDTLSQETIEIIHDIDFSTPPTGGDAWDGQLLGTNGGSTDDSGGNGLCMTVALTGSNFPFWESPAGFIDITDDTIYRVTAGLNALLPVSPPQNSIPIVEVVFDNFNGGGSGNNFYGGQAHLLDNSGGANGVGRVANEFTFMVAPPQNQASQWKAHLGDPAADSAVDLRVAFRLNDAGHNVGGGSDTDEGTICVETVRVEGINRAQLAQEASYTAAVTTSDFVVGGPGDAPGSGTDTPVSPTGWDVTLQVAPTGGATVYRSTFFLAAGGGFAFADLYPVAWEAGKIYRTRIGMHYVNPADVASNNVMGAILINMDTPQSEIGNQWNIRRGTGIAVGKATPDANNAEYESYLHGQQGTLSATPDADRVRGSVQMYEFGQFHGHGSNTETGALRIETFAVDTLTNP